jgi:hypothetical protein
MSSAFIDTSGWASALKFTNITRNNFPVVDYVAEIKAEIQQEFQQAQQLPTTAILSRFLSRMRA